MELNIKHSVSKLIDSWQRMVDLQIVITNIIVRINIAYIAVFSNSWVKTKKRKKKEDCTQGQ